MTADLGARIARLRQEFRVSFARTPKDFAELHRLRYDVFCSERGILPGQEGTESDPYDASSRHVVLRRVDGLMVGTVRLVPGVYEGQPQRFPMQRVCDPAIFTRKRGRFPAFACPATVGTLGNMRTQCYDWH
jgi:N-acyl amino acid synthase of PEP-CTERM/exosortase system